MKKIIFTATALLAIVSGTYSIYANGEEKYQQKDWPIENIIDYRENDQSNYKKKKRYSNQMNHQRASEREDWFEERHKNSFQNHELAIKNALDEGDITKEEASELREELQEYEEYKDEKDFSPRSYSHSNSTRRNRRFYNEHCNY